MNTENFLKKIEAAGLVGCGGAGFPTHVKWNTKNAQFLIVNAVECEPLLCTDRYLMRHFAPRIISACCQAADTLGVSHTVIAIKRGYRAEISALEEAISATGAKIALHLLDAFYPAGDEQVVVQEVTGCTVPYGSIPLDVGAVVSNVATMLAAADAVEDKPLVCKYITVAGEVGNPCIVKAPVGTPIMECIAADGGTTTKDPIIVSGGPMMGKLVSPERQEDNLVTKTTSGLLVFPRESYMTVYKEPRAFAALRRRAAASCIQCNYCTMLCPRHMLGHPLEPHRIMRTLALGGELGQILPSNQTLQSAALCSVCGVCTTYACPMGLQPSKVNAMLKEEMARQGIRGQRGSTEPDRNREMRKVPTERLISRLHIGKYEGQVGDELKTVMPGQVSILLRQGGGKLPEPLVSVGDHVKANDLIAKIPDGAMGANLHASIDGTVTEVADRITIVGR